MALTPNTGSQDNTVGVAPGGVQDTAGTGSVRTSVSLITILGLVLVLYPINLRVPHFKPYLALLAVVLFAAIYQLIRTPSALIGKTAICAAVITGTATVSMIAHTGLSSMRDFFWFNFFIFITGCMYFLLGANIRNRMTHERAITILIYCSFLISGVHFYEVWAGHPWDSFVTSPAPGVAPTEDSNYFRPGSIIGNSNPLGTFCASVTVLCFNRLLLQVRPIEVCGLAVNFVSTLLTLSRGGAVALLFGLMVSIAIHLILGRGQALVILWGAFRLAAILFVLVGVYFARFEAFSERFDLVLQDDNSLYRLEQWQAALKELVDDGWALVFGMGPGSSAAFYGRGISYEFRQDSLQANTFDSTPVSILYQYGFIGLTLALAPSLFLSHRVFKVRDPGEFWRIGVSLTVMVSCLFYEIFPYFACSYIWCLCFIWPGRATSFDGWGLRRVIVKGAAPGLTRPQSV